MNDYDEDYDENLEEDEQNEARDVMGEYIDNIDNIEGYITNTSRGLFDLILIYEHVDPTGFRVNFANTLDSILQEWDFDELDVSKLLRPEENEKIDYTDYRETIMKLIMEEVEIVLFNHLKNVLIDGITETEL